MTCQVFDNMTRKQAYCYKIMFIKDALCLSLNKMNKIYLLQKVNEI